MKRSAFFLLIICNVIWAFNPLLGKALLRTFSGVQVAWLRYVIGFLAYLVVAIFGILLFQKKWSHFFLFPKERRTFVDLLILASSAFVISPILQFVGLESSQAIENSILIATEPLITVLLAWVILSERMARDHWIAMGIALVGFLFFSGILGGALGLGTSLLFSTGMLLLLGSQVGEGTFSVYSRKLTQIHSPVAILGSGMGIGAGLLTLYMLVFDRLPNVAAMDYAQGFSAMWLGALGSTVTYLIWTVISRTVTVPTMALTLFIQPVAGALIGYGLLGERLTVERQLGAGLILSGIGYLVYREVQKERLRSVKTPSYT